MQPWQQQQFFHGFETQADVGWQWCRCRGVNKSAKRWMVWFQRASDSTQLQFSWTGVDGPDFQNCHHVPLSHWNSRWSGEEPLSYKLEGFHNKSTRSEIIIFSPDDLAAKVEWGEASRHKEAKRWAVHAAKSPLSLSLCLHLSLPRSRSPESSVTLCIRAWVSLVGIGEWRCPCIGGGPTQNWPGSKRIFPPVTVSIKLWSEKVHVLVGLWFLYWHRWLELLSRT